MQAPVERVAVGSALASVVVSEVLLVVLFVVPSFVLPGPCLQPVLPAGSWLTSNKTASFEYLPSSFALCLS
jgi:hypothetical protein